ncbi:hypothetical protein [Pyrodictium delaneyi]|nr:hypothetical protein [Pyrodictium delaneyi]
MPRGPGRLYRMVAMEVAGAAWRASIRSKARVEAVRVPSLKEVHVVVDGRWAVSVKVVERAWRVPPRLLARYAAMLLRHSRDYGRRARLLLVVPRLTSGALRLALRKRWFRVLPLSSVGVRGLAWWLLALLEELAAGIPSRSRALHALLEELRRSRRDTAGATLRNRME